jgi:hypothetical protein
MGILFLVGAVGLLVGFIGCAEMDYWVRRKALEKEFELFDSDARLMTRGGVTVGRRLNNVVILEKARSRPRSEIARLFQGNE